MPQFELLKKSAQEIHHERASAGHPGPELRPDYTPLNPIILLRTPPQKAAISWATQGVFEKGIELVSDLVLSHLRGRLPRANPRRQDPDKTGFAGLLVPTHQVNQFFRVDLRQNGELRIERSDRANPVDGVPVQTPPRGQAQGEEHAIGHRFPVPESFVVQPGLEGMPQGVSEVQQSSEIVLVGVLSPPHRSWPAPPARRWVRDEPHLPPINASSSFSRSSNKALVQHHSRLHALPSDPRPALPPAACPENGYQPPSPTDGRTDPHCSWPRAG